MLTISNSKQNLFRIQQLSGYQVQRARKNPNREIRKLLLNGNSVYVFWNGQSFEYRSVEHRRLIGRAILQKFESNAEAREALVATGNRVFVHQTERLQRLHTSLSSNKFCTILDEVRSSLLNNR